MRLAFRTLFRTPFVTTVAVLSLALGIGANTAIFSLVNTVLLRSLPVERPNEIVSIAIRGKDDSFSAFSHPNYIDFRDRNTVFSGLAGTRLGPEPMGLGVGDRAERVWGTPVSGNFFDVIAPPFALGRGFRPEEDLAGGNNAVTVISYSLWQQRFDGSPDVLGRTIRLNSRAFTIVGVTAAGFTGTKVLSSDLWIPLTAFPQLAGRQSDLLTMRRAVWMQGIGRLKPGVTIDQARQAMSTFMQQLAAQHSDVYRPGTGLAILVLVAMTVIRPREEAA